MLKSNIDLFVPRYSFASKLCDAIISTLWPYLDYAPTVSGDVRASIDSTYRRRALLIHKSILLLFTYRSTVSSRASVSTSQRMMRHFAQFRLGETS